MLPKKYCTLELSSCQWKIGKAKRAGQAQKRAEKQCDAQFGSERRRPARFEAKVAAPGSNACSTCLTSSVHSLEPRRAVQSNAFPSSIQYQQETSPRATYEEFILLTLQ
jgi:hypothetical protein